MNDLLIFFKHMPYIYRICVKLYIYGHNKPEVTDLSDNNSDTVNLLRECSSGVKIALDGINSLLKYSKTPALKRILQKSVVKHEEIACEVSRLLLENESSDGTPPAVMTAIEKGQISAKMLEIGRAHV